jgi:hypothetical protein
VIVWASILASSAVVAAAQPASGTPTPVSLSLAREVVQAQHRQVLVRDSYAKQLRAAMTFCRNDQRCQSDLNKAIAQAATEVSYRDAESIAQVLARKLTRPQLEAMLEFYRSPEGQAIATAEMGMSDEFAQIGHASSVYAQKSISQHFCPSHPEVCVNDLGRHPPLAPPKS